MSTEPLLLPPYNRLATQRSNLQKTAKIQCPTCERIFVGPKALINLQAHFFCFNKETRDALQRERPSNIMPNLAISSSSSEEEQGQFDTPMHGVGYIGFSDTTEGPQSDFFKRLILKCKNCYAMLFP